MGSWRNWAGNQRAADVEVVHPVGTAGIAAALTAAADRGRRVRPIGSGHSFTAIGRPEQVQLVLDRHAALLDVTADGLVTVQAGMPLHRVNAELAQRGWALENLGDIDRQTVAGALSTGTHGTGAAFGGLVTQVRALELVTADGTVLSCSPTEHPDVLDAARLGLGALGVLSTVTLQAVPAFALRMVEGPARLPDLLDGFSDVMTSTDHVEFYWFPHTDRCLLKRNTRVPLADGLDPLPRWRAVRDDEVLSNAVFAGVVGLGRRVPALVPPLARLAASALGPRTATDVAHLVFVSRRRVRFREMEYAVPRLAAPHALAEIARLVAAADWRIPFPVEVRVAAADDVPLSTAVGRDTAYVAVHVPARSEPGPYFDAVETVCRAVGGRPHWGKLHGLGAAELAGCYPRFAEFVALRDRLDPTGVLSNAHLDRLLGRAPRWSEMVRMSAADRREALLAAALRVMSRDGLAAGTTRAVVAEAGMSLASFHYAFASRDELLRELVDRVVGRELHAVAVTPAGSVADTLRAAAHGYFEHLAADPGAELFMLELTLHAVRDPALQPLAARQYAAYTAIAARLLDQVAEATGTAWRRPVPELARLLVTVLDGVTTTWLVDRDTAATTASLDAVLEMFAVAHTGVPA